MSKHKTRNGCGRGSWRKRKHVKDVVPVVRRDTKDRAGRKNQDTTGKLLHSALEGFASALAEILVDRYLERRGDENQEHDDSTVKSPRGSNRRDEP